MGVTLRWCIAGLAVALLSVSAAQAQVRGNDTGGIIPWSCENEAAAQELAAIHCSRWDKFHRITSVARQYGNYIGFNCLWRPDVARYIIPAVHTRSRCAAAPRLYPRVRVRY
jgi:hypothetical protein